MATTTAVCPRQCGTALHRTWPGEPALCRVCGYEDYDSYQCNEIESQLTSDARRRLGVMLPRGRRRRYAEDSEWLRHNAPAIPLTYERTRGRPRLAISVCVAFKHLLEVDGIKARAIGDYYGLNEQTVRKAARRAE